VLLENEAAMRLVAGAAREPVLALVRRALAAPASLAEPVVLPGVSGRPVVRVSIVRWMDEIAGAVVTVSGAGVRGGGDAALRDLERAAILDALARAGGNVTAAAAELGISRATVYRRLRTYRVLG
jgi:DNA-binding NtrC family response regulator